MLRALFILITLAFLSSCFHQEEESVVQNTPFLNVDHTKADSILRHMTLVEKIGQLIVLKTDLKNKNAKESAYQWVNEGVIGGVILEKLEVEEYVDVLDSLNSFSNIPLLNGTQEMVLLNNQFSDAVQFPLAPSIGAVQNDTIQKELEKLYLRQCKALGINFCISPSANRIFLDDKMHPFHVFENDQKTQLDRTNRVLENLQSENIISLGNTFSEFYQLKDDTTGILDTLLFRQNEMVKGGVSGFKIDEEIFETDSLYQLQSFFLKKYLKEKMEFDGLIVAEISAQATIDELLHSGTDIFIVRDSAKKVFDYLLDFVKSGLMAEKVINDKVRKILLAKTYAGLDKKPTELVVEDALAVLKNEYFAFQARQLFEYSITLAQNYNNLLPYTKTYKRDFRIINVGNEKLKIFKDYFSKYANYQNYNHPPDEQGKIKPLKAIFQKHSTAIVVLDNIDLDTVQQKDFVKSVNELSRSSKLTVVNFGNPLNLQYLDTTLSIIQIFEKNKITESLAPQLLFGGMSAKGKLQMDLTDSLTYGKSIQTPITRLKYTVPEEVGIAPEKLVGINAIIQSAISKKATPGGQVMVIKNGKVIFDQAFGHHTYRKKNKVQKSDLYDIASITKISATSLAAMKLFEEKEFKLADRLKTHLDLDEKSTIGRIRMKQLLTHSSGLQANMPIAKYYNNKDSIVDDCNQFFCKKPNDEYSIQIANDMFFNRKWIDSIWFTIDHLKVRRRGRYKYSDVNFNLVQRVLEKKMNQPMNEFLENNFYKSLNLRRTSFRPLEKFKSKYIVPTENDERWRGQLLRGYVHDESASLLGGVAGSAGLFSNANDLGIMFQMMLNGGSYGEQKYLDQKTIKKFTSANYGNHRGLGFAVKGRRGANSISSLAPKKTYGHTGFSGTCVWVDPENDLIFIFLSNRIHPNKSNTKLYRNQTRRRVHDVIYKSLDTYKKGRKGKDRVLVDL
ncbi:MAG: serine hydrolase [Saprospiraceae bacterium]